MQTFLYTLHFIVCFVLIGVVLLQRGKGADLGASLGGGGANTIFGSRGAGNFLTRMTTVSAIIFMGTSLTLSYYGYKASDVRLFDETQPFEVPAAPDAPAPDADGATTEQTGGLEEIPAAGSDGASDTGAEAGGGPTETPAADATTGAPEPAPKPATESDPARE